MKKLFTLLSVILISGVSCKKEQKIIPPDPAPEASFTYVLDRLSHNVSFTNTSKNGLNYSWSFGDGYNTTEFSPKHHYSEEDTYKVSLVVYTYNAKQKDKDVQTIIIKSTFDSMRINKIVLNSIDFKNAKSEDYDTDGGPDVYFKIVNEAETVLFSEGTVKKDVGPGSFPIVWNLSPAPVFTMNQKFVINFYDNDAPEPSEYMGGIIFNSGFFRGSYPLEYNVNLGGKNFDLSLSYE
ncbi:MAG: PKD domain-containing protein [Chitinophagaceae bacterium]